MQSFDDVFVVSLIQAWTVIWMPKCDDISIVSQRAHDAINYAVTSVWRQNDIIVSCLRWNAIIAMLQEFMLNRTLSVWSHDNKSPVSKSLQ